MHEYCSCLIEKLKVNVSVEQMMSVTIKVILFSAFFVVLYDEIKGDCYNNYECFGSYVCCKPNDLNYQCSADCIGKSCVSNSDCGGYDEYCCNYECQKGICGLAGWVVVLIVMGILGGIGAIVGVALCYYCSYRRRTPGVILAPQPAVAVPATTVVAGSSQVTYGYGQVYPPVQQPMSGYGYGPPPAYPQPPQAQK